MIRRCTDADLSTIALIVNEAEAYRGVIPPDCWHQPYMSRIALEAERAAEVNFSGWEYSNTLIGVMGLQKVRGATLVRHAYVRPAYQGRGIGSALLTALGSQADRPLFVGRGQLPNGRFAFTRHGFHRVSIEEKDRRETSVFLISN